MMEHSTPITYYFLITCNISRSPTRRGLTSVHVYFTIITYLAAKFMKNCCHDRFICGLNLVDGDKNPLCVIAYFPRIGAWLTWSLS